MVRREEIHVTPLVGRESQQKQLLLLLSEELSSPPLIIIHGPEATGKTSLISSVLPTTNSQYLTLQCREFITARHLFERVITEISNLIQDLKNGSASVRCEGINPFLVALSGVTAHFQRFVLVLDGIDQSRETLPTLLPSLARAGEIIPNLTMIFVMRYPSSRYLQTTGIPHIICPTYSRDQACAILALHPQNVSSPDHSSNENITCEDDAWLWSQYCQAIWDSLAKGSARDLMSFSALCHRLWRPFVQPIIESTYGPRDFSRLVIYQRKLLQDESYLQNDIIFTPSPDLQETTQHDTLNFPYMTKWVICAAYLASYNPVKLDTTYFMKSTERKRKKKGGGTRAGRPAKTSKISRHLLSAAPFSLDRLFAILHAIIPHDIASNLDLYTQISTLSSLRLLLRTGLYSIDVLDSSSKWRVTYNWEYVTKIARSIKFDIHDYATD